MIRIVLVNVAAPVTAQGGGAEPMILNSLFDLAPPSPEGRPAIEVPIPNDGSSYLVFEFSPVCSEKIVSLPHKVLIR